jgi:flagellum-specific peptidoglycan hydrolase FlgJ
MSHLSSTQLTALAQAARNSVLCEHTTTVPAELTVAQWALESAWGTHQPGNNCFGIKAYDGCFGVQSLKTLEYVNGQPKSVLKQFATFPSLAACFEQHAAIICKGAIYAKVWGSYLASRNVLELIRGVAAIYATEPSYADMLLRIGAMAEIIAALAHARHTITA